MTPSAALLARMSMEPDDYPPPKSAGKASRAQLRDVVAREVQALLRSDVDDDPVGELDDDTLILLQAMAELDEEAGVQARAWNPALHKRWPRGHPKAGKFRPMINLLKTAIAKHDGTGHPFEHFNREQLRKAAKARGITLKRGEGKDSIAKKLLADLGGKPTAPAAPAKKAAKKAVKKATPAAPARQPGTRTVLGTEFTPAMQTALVDIEDSGGMQKQRSDFQLEYDLSDEEMDRLVDGGFVEVDDEAGGGGFIGATPRGVRALAELTAQQTAPAKKVAKKVTAPAPRPNASPAAAPTPSSSPQGKLIGDLIPDSYRIDPDREREITRIVEERLNGRYAGLTVKVTRVNPSVAQTTISADILDVDGSVVGITTREFNQSGGKLWVYHALLELEPHVQGQGFAEAWNGHLMDWYSESGVDRIEVTANIDVGGYTWARQGFDFKTQIAADEIASLLGLKLRRDSGRSTPRYDADQTAAAQGVLDRMNRLPFGDPNYPTAYEVSQAGRKPGQGKDDSWPGKDAMLGSTWGGVKPVPAPSGAPAVP